MYSETDIQSAVDAGAMTPEAANALRAHVAGERERPATDEENFRLVNSFNDIFVTIAAILLLVAMAGIGQAFTPNIDGPPPMAGLLVAGSAWLMAEFFTRKRRMALPSIVLLLAFVGGVFAALLGTLVLMLGSDNFGSGDEMLIASLVSGCALLTAGSSWVHWKRFKVPITIAAGAAAAALTVIALIVGALATADSNPENLVLGLVFVAGLAIFAFAMRWDISDRIRQTRRSDVAFWLHLLAAPMIAHPLFHMLGVTSGDAITPAAAAGVLVVYVALGIVALAIDRRALLVSALAYVLVALTYLFDRFGAVELNVALTALVIGSALLTLSAFWTPIRNKVVGALPANMQTMVPAAA